MKDDRLIRMSLGIKKLVKDMYVSDTPHDCGYRSVNLSHLSDNSGTMSSEHIQSFLDEINKLPSLPFETIIMDSALAWETLNKVTLEPEDFIGLPSWKDDDDDYLAATRLREQFDKYNITESEEEYVEDILSIYGVGSIDEFMRIPNSKLNWKGLHTRSVFEQRLSEKQSIEARNKKMVPKVCDCGAKHTSFPNHHYNWCDTKRS